MDNMFGSSLQDNRKKQWKSFISDLEDEFDDDSPLAIGTLGGGSSNNTATSNNNGNSLLLPTTALGRRQVTDRESESKKSAVGLNNPANNDSTSPKGAGNNLPSLQWNPVTMNSLYMQQLRGGLLNFKAGNLGTKPERKEEHKPEPEKKFEILPTLSLRDWIAYYASEQTPSNNLLTMGMGSISTSSRVDKGFLEKATRVALSLVKKLDERYERGELPLHDNDIIVGKVRVNDTATGEVDFVNITSPDPSSDSGPQKSGQLRSERSAIKMLGRVFYEIFTQGTSPLVVFEGNKSNSSSGSAPLPFDLSLKIGDGQIDNEADDGVEQDEPRRKQNRRVSKKRQNHYEALQEEGLPPSICRLVADMLENEEALDGSEGLFRSDQAVASFSDVISDLLQMVNKPNSFLHDSFLMRLEPIIPGDKLYGRSGDLRRCSEIAKGMSQSTNQSAIMVSGEAGTGKSSLVREMSKHLQEQGWQVLQCKFDQEVHPRPLSIITSAFDRFLMNLVSQLDVTGQKEVSSRLVTVFDDEDIAELCRLVPALRELVPVNDTLSKPGEGLFNFPEASKCRLHRLFGLLVKTLSSKTRPLLLVFDDLQWVDPSSINLLSFLLLFLRNDVCEDDGEEFARSPMLFVGCYRSEEITSSSPIFTCIQQLKGSSSVSLKEVHLEGLSSKDVNDLVSDSLIYPRRLTLPLSNLIHQKTAGSPLYLKEMLKNLASENLLTFSLSKHKWQFDLELIELKTVSDGVVDLLAKRLEGLPGNTLKGLQIMSCLGSEVSPSTLFLLENMCSDISGGLDTAVDKLLLKKNSNGSYCFVHDMIQQTVSQGLEQNDRVRMLKDIADTLIEKTTSERTDTVLFTIVDLIKRVGARNVPSNDDRALYAQLNLSASEMAIKIPDYDSANRLIECGISFLNKEHWSLQYNLSLDLFSNAALVNWALGSTDITTKRIEEVLHHAKCFQDKLASMNVLVRSLSIHSESIEKAYEHCFMVLEALGVSFPKELNNELIAKELADTNLKLQGIGSLDSLPLMEDPQKKEAMRFLSIAMYLSYQQKNKHLPLIGCHMVRLTITHGRDCQSSFGLVTMALSFARHDIDVAYKLGKVVMKLHSTPECFSPNAAYIVTACINIWKEPWQCMVPPLLECHKDCLKCGDITIACSIATSIVYRSFFVGSQLDALENGHISAFLGIMERHKRRVFYLYTIPISNAICDFTGGPRRCAWDGINGLEDDNKNLFNAVENRDITLAECIVVTQLMQCFIFRRIDKAEQIIRQYQAFFDRHQPDQPLNTIMGTFYTGLIASYCLRETKDKHWQNIALNASQAMDSWSNHRSSWNFHNKSLLLKAEYHYAMGEFDKAAEEYQQSMTAAHDHHFVHEEAVGSELAAYFYQDRGQKDLANESMKRAIECYQSWGAEKKCVLLRQAMGWQASTITTEF